MVTSQKIAIIDPVNQNMPAMLVIYNNTSSRDVSFKAIMNDGDRIEAMPFNLPAKTKTSWVWRPLTDNPRFEIIDFNMNMHDDGDFSTDGIIDSPLAPNVNI